MTPNQKQRLVNVIDAAINAGFCPREVCAPGGYCWMVNKTPEVVEVVNGLLDAVVMFKGCQDRKAWIKIRTSIPEVVLNFTETPNFFEAVEAALLRS